MRYIALSVRLDRFRRLQRLIPTVERFEGVSGCGPRDYRQDCIPKSYDILSDWAVEQKLDKGTIVMQDDVWLPHGPGFDAWVEEFTEPLVVFGRTENTGIVVPKAFCATPTIWKLLAKKWNGKGRIGPAWMPTVEKHGLVLDVTRQL